ncbi:MAG: hypothetical protein KF741_13735 [Ferruginibacter sp.]|nr:hypothetical protein [Bacteroidota bacterium]MBX2920299.1 hypothetical protein [Ferruginibacter sp.]
MENCFKTKNNFNKNEIKFGRYIQRNYFCTPILKNEALFKVKVVEKANNTQLNLGDKIKTHTFALPIKKGAKSTVKSSLKVWKQQQITIWLSR